MTNGTRALRYMNRSYGMGNKYKATALGGVLIWRHSLNTNIEKLRIYLKFDISAP